MKTLAEILNDNYPSVIVDDRQSDIHCCRGWWPLIWPVASRMHQYNLEMEQSGFRSGNVVFDCIKEKFGGLRLYVSGVGWRVVEHDIAAAEAASRVVCEMCGKPGSRTNDGWIRTECRGCERSRTEGN